MNFVYFYLNFPSLGFILNLGFEQSANLIFVNFHRQRNLQVILKLTRFQIDPS